jgi:hypothetical protein
MSGTQQPIHDAGRDAQGRSSATQGSRKRRRRGRLDTGADVSLRLLPGKTRPMTGEEERQLVEALAELLVEWVEARPEWLPAGLRTGRGCDLDGCSRAKEQP